MSCQRTRRHARGLCAACGEPWKGPQWECDPCRAIHTVKDLARRAERECGRIRALHAARRGARLDFNARVDLGIADAWIEATRAPHQTEEDTP